MSFASTRATGGHTPLDLAALTAAGIDPASTQPREHEVRCTFCPARTLNQMGGCDQHYRPPHAVVRAEAVAS